MYNINNTTFLHIHLLTFQLPFYILQMKNIIKKSKSMIEDNPRKIRIMLE